MKKLIYRWKQLSKKKKALIILLVLALAAAGAYALGLFDKESFSTGGDPSKPIYSQLTGVETDKTSADLPILGVMIENHPDARPQTGLSTAGIVFETVAEGGITRYLALFQENAAKDLGSVRSVRAYYLDWAMGFDASIAHAGGSADALELIESRDAKSLSQFKYPEPYRRVNNLDPPHDLFASTDKLRDLQKELGHKKAVFDEIPRSSDSPTQTPNATSISIDYSYADYAVRFQYDPATNSYQRFNAGKPDIDAGSQKQIAVKNLIVIKMPSTTIKAIGSGDALLYKDGTVQNIHWKQASYKERIKFTNPDGTEVALNRGSTWIAALPSSGEVTHK